MRNRTHKLRVVTYNVHRCAGLDRRVRPQRIVDVLREVDADIIALQEVVSVDGGLRHENQARYIAEHLDMDFYLGENRRHRGGSYGNVLLTRLPVTEAMNYDITVRGRERRGCLRADVRANDTRLLHIFNVHMGTAYLERRHQARKLVTQGLVGNGDLEGHRIVLGDFNEWVKGLATRLLEAHLESPDLRSHVGQRRSYPGFMPVMHLDHIYYDPELELEKFSLHRSRLALMASDHLPLFADFHLN